MRVNQRSGSLPVSKPSVAAGASRRDGLQAEKSSIKLNKANSQPCSQALAGTDKRTGRGERLRTSRFSGISLLSALPDAKGEATLVPRISMTRDQNRAEGNSATLGAHQEAVPRRKVYPFPRRPKRRRRWSRWSSSVTRRTLRQPPPSATGTCGSALAAVVQKSIRCRVVRTACATARDGLHGGRRRSAESCV